MCLIGLELFVAIISLFSVGLSSCPACHVHTCSFLSVVCLSYGFHVLTTFMVNKRIYNRHLEKNQNIGSKISTVVVEL